MKGVKREDNGEDDVNFKCSDIIAVAVIAIEAIAKQKKTFRVYLNITSITSICNK